jgi:hypothetical protein
MEMKSINERKLLQETFDINVAQIKVEHLKMIDKGLDDKTREIYLENLRIKDELKIQSKEAENVLRLNSSISERDRELRNELQLSQSAEKELTNRLGTYQYLIKQLNDRNTELEEKCDGLLKKQSALIESSTRSDDFDFQVDEQSVNLGFLNILSSYYSRKVDKKRAERVSQKDFDIIVGDAFDAITKKYPNRFRAFLKKQKSVPSLPEIPIVSLNDDFSPQKFDNNNLKWWSPNRFKIMRIFSIFDSNL